MGQKEELAFGAATLCTLPKPFWTETLQSILYRAVPPKTWHVTERFLFLSSSCRYDYQIQPHLSECIECLTNSEVSTTLS